MLTKKLTSAEIAEFEAFAEELSKVPKLLPEESLIMTKIQNLKSNNWEDDRLNANEEQLTDHHKRLQQMKMKGLNLLK